MRDPIAPSPASDEGTEPPIPDPESFRRADQAIDWAAWRQAISKWDPTAPAEAGGPHTAPGRV